jgi:hypothetical protein
VYLLQLLDVTAPRSAVLKIVPTWEPGGFVAAYDPEVGMTSLVVTTDKAEALRFASARDAMELWRSVPARAPVRPDGKPNRPLTSFTVSVAGDDYTA